MGGLFFPPRTVRKLQNVMAVTDARIRSPHVISLKDYIRMFGTMSLR